jgi:hypothetical protein
VPKFQSGRQDLNLRPLRPERSTASPRSGGNRVVAPFFETASAGLPSVFATFRRLVGHNRGTPVFGPGSSDVHDRRDAELKVQASHLHFEPPDAVGSLECYERLTPAACILAGSVCATFNRGRLSCPW